ncbi:MAG: YtxH domain-containing protein [Acidimicrobiia bacterium]
MLTLITLPFRVGFGTARLAVRTGRLVGLRRLFVFGAGVGVGLLVAPTTGRELRERIARRLDAAGPSGDQEIAERVRFELSHSPRTWHLPQPEVDVVAGTAVLRGEVPHVEGRADLERAAAAVAGVVAVDNHVEVALAGTNGHG